jgi:hypothetical protein
MKRKNKIHTSAMKIHITTIPDTESWPRLTFN